MSKENLTVISAALPLTGRISLFHRTWPMAFIAIGLMVTAAWTGLLGYGLFTLAGMMF